MGKKEKILVALSGGVDSSVSAALLQQEGFEVHGAFIRTWSPPWMPCTWREDRRDAMRVCAHLHIPFHTVDLSKEYEQDVAKYMIASYSRGETPNPDVMCNKYVKFGAFFSWAQAHGFSNIATGHYARVRRNGTVWNLCSGVDTQKDQTYFLWTLTQAQLSRTRFPIGDLKKTEVRALAESFHLPTAKKKDSQGICFLGAVDMKAFLTHYIPLTPGNVLDMSGEVIGRHDGALFYTPGQRHGFTVYKKTPNMPPVFVVRKDCDANTITVAPKEAEATHSVTEVHIRDISFTGDPLPNTFSCEARFRYRQPLFPVTVTKLQDTLFRVTFGVPHSYVAKGQSMVFYSGEVCLGGGIIA